MDPSLWQDIVEKTVNKLGRNFPSDVREDIKQDCWIAICQSRTLIDEHVETYGQVETRGYVIRICRNVVADAVAKCVKQLPTEPLETQFKTPTQSQTEVKKSSDPFGFGVSTAELLDALNHLDKNQRFVIDCVFFRRMTEDQVGAEVNKSQQWVSKEKTAAIVALRKLLKGKTCQ